MKKIILILMFCLLSAGTVAAQKTFLVTSKAAGVVRLGMTVSQARKALKGYKLKRESDGEGVALIGVTRGGKTVMTLSANEKNADAPINEKAKIDFIEVWDASYKTADGIHPQMTIAEAERILGKVKKIIMSEIEQREYVTFTKKPNLSFRVSGKDHTEAGIYAEGKRESTKTGKGAIIASISVPQN